MGSRITVRPTTSVGVIGLIAIISGVVMAVVGVGAWVVVSQQLGSERITVADDAPFYLGRASLTHSPRLLKLRLSATMHSTRVMGAHTLNWSRAIPRARWS